VTLTRAHVEELEARLGVRLPPFLASALLRRNGGYVRKAGRDWALFPACDPSDRHTLSKTADDIARETASAREFAALPAGCVAIGRAPDHDWLVLRPLDGGRLGDAVFVWNRYVGELVLLVDHVAELWEADG
jgi:hypothetical protein